MRLTWITLKPGHLVEFNMFNPNKILDLSIIKTSVDIELTHYQTTKF